MKADAVKIGEGVYWIGVMDWDIRSYDGYTLKGTTYNAFLVFGDDEVALIDNTILVLLDNYGEGLKMLSRKRE